MSSSELAVLTEPWPSAARIVLAGEMDEASAPAAWRAIDEALDAEPRELRINLAQLTFCDSAGISALVHARNRATARGAALVLEAPTESVLRVLLLTGLTRVFDID